MAASECESPAHRGRARAKRRAEGPVACLRAVTCTSLLAVSVGRRVISVAHREFGIVRSVSQAPNAQDLTISVIGSAYE